MLTIFILALVAIGLAASLGFTVISFQHSMMVTATTQRNVARMEAIAHTIRASARPVVAGGAVRVPMGRNVELDNGETRTLLPELVGDDLTPWGALYGYCPRVISSGVADGDGASSTVYGGGDAEWGITVKGVPGAKLVSGAVGQPSISSIGGGVAPDNILGFVLSPVVDRFEVPHCDEVIYRDGAFIIGMADANGDDVPDGPATVGGTVTPIILETSSIAFLSSDIEPTLFVAHDGEGSGASSGDRIGLKDAVIFWKASKPKSIVFNLEDGDYDISDVAPVFAAAEAERSVRFIDASPSSSEGARLTAAAPMDVVFGIDASLEGISVDPQIRLRSLAGSNVTIAQSRIGHLRVDGGNVLLKASTSVERSSARGGSAIEVTSGNLAIAEDVVGSVLAIDNGGAGDVAIMAFGGTVTISASISAPEATLPWSFTGTGRLTVGQTLSGGDPLVSYAGAAALPVKALERVSANGEVSATAMCHAIRPHAIAGSCSTDHGGLQVSQKVISGQVSGWECSWVAAGDPVAPSASTAVADCSASPM